MPRLKTIIQTLEAFRSIHGETYDYSLVEYTTARDKLKIICSTHGIFEQLAYSHISGSGCSKCAPKNGRKLIPLTKLLSQFNKVHGDRYDYSFVEYTGGHNKVKIICKVHGPFNQTPANHKSGSNCPYCVLPTYNKSVYKNRETILYYIKIGGIYKIGLTMSSIKKRFKYELDNNLNIEIIKQWVYADGSLAFEREQEILNKFQEFKYLGENIIRTGNTEMFITDVLMIDI